MSYLNLTEPFCMAIRLEECTKQFYVEWGTQTQTKKKKNWEPPISIEMWGSRGDNCEY